MHVNDWKINMSLRAWHLTFQSSVELSANNSSWLAGQAYSENLLVSEQCEFKSCRVDFFLISTFLSGRIINNCKMNLEFRILEKKSLKR